MAVLELALFTLDLSLFTLDLSFILQFFTFFNVNFNLFKSYSNNPSTSQYIYDENGN